MPASPGACENKRQLKSGGSHAPENTPGIRVVRSILSSIPASPPQTLQNISPNTFSCGNYVIVGGYDGVAHVLDVKDGASHWRVRAGDAIRSSPTLCPATGRIFFGSHDGAIYVLNVAQRHLLGKIDPAAAQTAETRRTFVPPSEENATAEGSNTGLGPVAAPVALHPSGIMCYLATLRSYVVAIRLPLPSPEDRTVTAAWQARLRRPIFGGPVLASQQAILLVPCVDHCIYGLDSETGFMRWRIETGAPLFCSPRLGRLDVLRQPVARQTAEKGISSATSFAPAIGDEEAQAAEFLVVGSNDGILRYVEIDSGRLVAASESCGAHIVASPALLPTGDGSNVLAATVDGSLHFLKMEAGALREVDHLRLAGQVFSSPTLIIDPRSQPCATIAVLGCRDDHLYGIRVTDNNTE